MTYDELQALLPESAIELVGSRQEVVIYTGWTLDGEYLVPMEDD